MPMYKYKHPDVYPTSWHDAFHYGRQQLIEFNRLEKSVARLPEKYSALTEQNKAKIIRKKISAFKHMINMTPNHPLGKVIEECEIATGVVTENGELFITLTFTRKANWAESVAYAVRGEDMKMAIDRLTYKK